MFGIGIPEVIIIGLVLAMLFFGSKKIVDFSRSMGRMSGEFKKGKQEIERELRESERDAMKEEEQFKSTAASSQPAVSPTNQSSAVPMGDNKQNQ